jgi:hypothetical protein
MHTCLHAYIHTYIHTYIHACTSNKQKGEHDYKDARAAADQLLDRLNDLQKVVDGLRIELEEERSKREGAERALEKLTIHILGVHT